MFCELSNLKTIENTENTYLKYFTFEMKMKIVSKIHVYFYTLLSI